MNHHDDNKYEFYSMDAYWNRTPDTGPVVADTLIKQEHALIALKVLYGEFIYEDNPTILTLPNSFGTNNMSIVESWFTISHLDAQVKLELGFTTHNFPNDDEEKNE